MPRTPEDLLKEVAAWPPEQRLRFAARLLEMVAAEFGGAAAKRLPAGGSDTLPLAAAGEEAARSAAPGPAPAAPRPESGRPGVRSGAALPSTRPGAVTPSAPAAASPAPETRRLVVVDGSNFLGTVPGFNLATGAAREELVLRLQEFSHSHPAFRTVVYFDGQKTTVQRYGRLEIRFTSGQRPADFHILELLRGLGEAERREALLVTADRALADAARKLGAKIEAPASFHRRLPGAARKAIGERGLSAAEVADWEAYFQQPPAPPKKKP